MGGPERSACESKQDHRAGWDHSGASVSELPHQYLFTDESDIGCQGPQKAGWLQDTLTCRMGQHCSRLSHVLRKALGSFWLCAPQAGSPKWGAIFCFTQRCRVKLIPSYTRHTWAGHTPHSARQCEHLNGPWRGLSPINTDPWGSQAQLGSPTHPHSCSQQSQSNT